MSLKTSRTSLHWKGDKGRVSQRQSHRLWMRQQLIQLSAGGAGRVLQQPKMFSLLLPPLKAAPSMRQLTAWTASWSSLLTTLCGGAKPVSNSAHGLSCCQHLRGLCCTRTAASSPSFLYTTCANRCALCPWRCHCSMWYPAAAHNAFHRVGTLYADCCWNYSLWCAM